jgi:sugar lactone lactonase YvrE
VLFNDGPMPTGVAVSKDGRIFVNFPRWGDPVEFTVAEIKEGKAIAYPDADINKLKTGAEADHLISVQSVTMDSQNRLWIVDTGSINMQPIKPGAAKLLCVDLQTNQIVKRIDFPDTVALPSSYLNDVRFDLTRGKEGTAFLTDSSDSGPNGIIVVDLATATSWRKLNDDPSTKADQNFSPIVEGEPFMAREKNQPPAYVKIGSDGIAIDSQRGVLYYCPMASHRLYCVSLDALMNKDLSDADVAKQVKEMPPRDFASDGLICDKDGTLFLTDYEHNAIHFLSKDKYPIFVSDPRILWPDSMAIGPSMYLYFTANQLQRQAKFHDGKDLRQRPFVLFRAPIGSAAMAMSQ